MGSNGGVLANEGSAQQIKYFSKEELLNPPTCKDGVPLEKERQWRKACLQVIMDVVSRMKLPVWAMYNACWLFNYYFAQRSMVRNDRFLIATACTFLVLKADETPRKLEVVCAHFEMARWARKAAAMPDAPRKWEDKRHMERFRDEVLTAERAVLYTTGFVLELPSPYRPMLTIVKELRAELPDREAELQVLMQAAWNFMNDSPFTHVGLRHTPRHIALAGLFVASVVTGMPLPIKDGYTFCSQYGMPQAILQDILDEMMAGYEVAAERALRGAGGVTSASGAAGPGPPSAGALTSPAGQPGTAPRQATAPSAQQEQQQPQEWHLPGSQEAGGGVVLQRHGARLAAAVVPSSSRQPP